MSTCGARSLACTEPAAWRPGRRCRSAPRTSLVSSLRRRRDCGGATIAVVAGTATAVSGRVVRRQQANATLTTTPFGVELALRLLAAHPDSAQLIERLIELSEDA